MYRVCLLLLMFTASACALVDWQDAAPDSERTGPSDIVLTNASGKPIYFKALELQLSHRVDPIPSFDPAASPFPKVAAGASVAVDDIDRYRPGDDIRLFLYALRQTGEEDAVRAVLTELRTVTDEELRQSGGRITVGKL